jgi:hypothetical protein
MIQSFWLVFIRERDFPYAEHVDINGNKGYLQELIESGEEDTNTSGLLRWVQDGKYVEMNSSRLPKEKLLEIARLMK